MMAADPTTQKEAALGRVSIKTIVVPVVVLACLSWAPAHARESAAADSIKRPPPKPRHTAIRDWLAYGVAAGAIAGIAEGQCEDEAIVLGPLVGHSVIVLVLGLFAGVSWGGEDPGMENPYTEIHWRDWSMEPATSLEALLDTGRWKGRVQVRLKDGTSLAGSLAELTDQAIIVRTRGDSRAVDASEIREVRRPRDSVLDGFLWSAGAGALYGTIWANGCEGGAPKSERRVQMAAIGAGVLGGTGLILDWIHGGPSGLYRAEAGAMIPALEPEPVWMAGGGGLALRARF